MDNIWSSSVPRHRRYELLATGMLIIYMFFFGIIITIAFLLSLFYGNVYMKTVCILYLVFYYIDYDTPNKGGRGNGCEWIRDWRIWKYFLDYFPIDLVKTVELPPNRHYLLGVFPHGVICLGALGNAMTNHSKWRTLFPSVRAKLLTVNFHFRFPIYREMMLSWGLSSASAGSMNALLSQSRDLTHKSNRDGFTSNAAIVIVGGAREAFLSAPNAYKIFLRKRKGFVRVAIQSGAALVPVIAFGEPNVYDTTQNKRGTWLRKMQELVKKYTTIAPIVFNGRGFLQESFGLIPRRHPITLVVGAPIHTVKNKFPSCDDINDMHATYTKQLVELFETHKHNYIEHHDKIHLEIL